MNDLFVETKLDNLLSADAIFAFLQLTNFCLAFAMLTTRSISPTRSENIHKFCDLCVSSAAIFEMERHASFSVEYETAILDLCSSEMSKFPWNVNKYSVSTICRLKWKHFAIEQTRIHLFCKQIFPTAFVYIAFAYEIEILVLFFMTNDYCLVTIRTKAFARFIHCWRI